MGAIICFEQEANLDEFVASGGTFDRRRRATRSARVDLRARRAPTSSTTARSSFATCALRMAGVFFPMPETKSVDKSLGTRHRAAIGVSDETDAVVVIVSEERGTISVCLQRQHHPEPRRHDVESRRCSVSSATRRKKKKTASPSGRRSFHRPWLQQPRRTGTSRPRLGCRALPAPKRPFVFRACRRTRKNRAVFPPSAAPRRPCASPASPAR